MGVYINKAELLKQLSVIQDRPVRSAMQIIKILPTIDLVRCKDCKYVLMLRSESSAKEFGQIYECRKGIFNCPKSNDFCSRAERKSE